MQEIVIKIPDRIHYAIEKDIVVNGSKASQILIDAVANGTVLPKGHGRLGDLDKIWSELKELEEHYQAEFLKESNAIHESAMNGRLYGFTNSKFIVQDAPTIIKADRSEE